MNNKSKYMKRALLVIVILLMAYPLFVFGRFKYWEWTTTPETLSQSKTMTIFYREKCRRCRKVMPWLIFKHSLDKNRVNVVNANHYQRSSLEEIGVYITPLLELTIRAITRLTFQKLKDFGIVVNE